MFTFFCLSKKSNTVQYYVTPFHLVRKKYINNYAVLHKTKQQKKCKNNITYIKLRKEWGEEKHLPPPLIPFQYKLYVCWYSSVTISSVSYENSILH